MYGAKFYTGLPNGGLWVNCGRGVAPRVRCAVRLPRGAYIKPLGILATRNLSDRPLTLNLVSVFLGPRQPDLKFS
jgi:hypothetical protein